MRLTLRTLLAYMDDILDPEDSKAIAKKVQESSFATNLLHRIRDVTRRLRLGAPSVEERGAGLDSNTVAEYLDNTLPDSQVPDFEKVCLESDVHLAEVASCHQVLAMVLGEPAEVDPDSRQRMYHLPEMMETDTSTLAEPGAIPVDTPRPDGNGSNGNGQKDNGLKTEAGPPPLRPRVPEYLLDTPESGRGWRIAAGVAIVLVCVAALLWFGGVGNRFSGGIAGRDAADQSQDPDPSAPREDAALTGPSEDGDDSSHASRARDEANHHETESGVSDPLAKNISSVEEKSPPPPPPQMERREGTSAAADTKLPPPQAESPPRPPAEALAGVERPRPPIEGEPAHAAGPLKQSNGPPPAPPKRIGLFVSPKEVLLRVDPKSGAWHRLGDQAVISSHDRLLALPAFRPAIAIVGKLQIEFVDGATAQFLPSSAQSPPNLALEYGRFVLRAEEPGGRLRVQLGEQAGTLTFDGPNSVVGIQAARLPSGGDPETQPGPIVAELFVASGKVIWQEEPNGKPTPLAAPDRLAVAGPPSQTKPSGQPSRWISEDTTSPLDKRAAPWLEKNLIPDRPALDSLIEATRRKEREVRWLATRSLALVGEYKPLVDALRTVDNKNVWTDYIEQMRGAVIRGPQSAAQVRTTMERVFGQDGSTLYEMLWKYHSGALRVEEARQLVSYLDHDELAFRVLAFRNLLDPANPTLTYGYRPEDPYSRRQVAVRRWKDMLRGLPTPRERSPIEEGKPMEPAEGEADRHPVNDSITPPRDEHAAPEADAAPQPKPE